MTVPPEAAVLDEMETPDGPWQLIAFRDGGTVCIGTAAIAEDTRHLRGAIFLHTGSVARYVEATAELWGSWGVAWGGVSPEIVRAAVLNDDHVEVPARVFSLPVELDEPYRAAWGIAQGCRSECELIGYDDEGWAITSAIARSAQRVPTVDERLQRVREVTERALRSYATAYLGESDAAEKERLRLYMDLVAPYLALADRPDIDDRGMLGWCEAIVRRYIEEARTNPWQPTGQP